MLFGRRSDWSDYERDILFFCSLLHKGAWTPSRRAREFLQGVQRGYHRVGLAGACDAWMAMGASCLWSACCEPDRLQLVMAGTTKMGELWIRLLRRMAADADEIVRENVLFSEDNTAVFLRGSDVPVIVVLTPGQLVEGGARVQNGRPTSLVVPDADRVPTRWIPSLRRLVDGAHDQWLTVAPVRR